MTILYLEWEGPTIQVSKTLQTQACLVHGETYDADLVVASMPGGKKAGWFAPPVWQSTITTPDEGNQPEELQVFRTGNPRLNAKNQLMWLVVKRTEWPAS
jgi:hypothetical protein